VVGSNGAVTSYDSAGSFGDLPGQGVAVNDIVGLVPDPSGNGYWLIGSDGGTFAFDGVPFAGSLPGISVRVDDIVGAVPA
jgi:hypothetical protein